MSSPRFLCFRYFDPQYFLNRHLTKASDVYSYGVCLLELITGQKAIDHTRGEANLIEWVSACHLTHVVSSMHLRTMHLPCIMIDVGFTIVYLLASVLILRILLLDCGRRSRG
jgi:hypothetical protein